MIFEIILFVVVACCICVAVYSVYRLFKVIREVADDEREAAREIKAIYDRYGWELDDD